MSMAGPSDTKVEVLHSANVLPSDDNGLSVSEESGPASLDSVDAGHGIHELEFSECRIDVGGVPARVSASRTAGGMISAGREQPLYHVVAWIPLHSGRYVKLDGFSARRRRQEEFLIVVRTARITMR
jgi:hypothetical protein